MIVTFAGHSNFIKSEIAENKILSILERIVADEKAEFYLGGYGDFDEFAFECCKKYKLNHPKVSLILITPYIRTACNLNAFDGIIYPEIERVPLKFAISFRNKWMVNKADYVICAVDHDWGGAYTTYRYAKLKKKSVFNILGM